MPLQALSVISRPCLCMVPSGKAVCWGAGTDGSVLPDSDNRSLPTGLSSSIMNSMNSLDGMCWGDNSFGQLGERRRVTPVNHDSTFVMLLKFMMNMWSSMKRTACGVGATTPQLNQSITDQSFSRPQQFYTNALNIVWCAIGESIFYSQLVSNN